MRRVLVTGANGFVGRAVCSEFLKRGMSVSAGVRGATGAVVAGAEPFPIGDLARPASRDLRGVDAVVHLAGIAHELHGQNAEAVYQAVNCDATERLARDAATAGARRFVFMSSIKVNGDSTPIDRPFREDDAPAPQDRYARSKWAAEQALSRVARETSLEVVVVRPPLVYGPGVRANFLRLVRLVERGIPLPLASVRNKRSLVYVDNLASLIGNCLTSARALGVPLLVTDAESPSTPDLILEIARALGRSANLVRFPPSLLRALGIPFGQLANINRLLQCMLVDGAGTCSRLAWQPPFSLREGIERTIAWYISRLDSKPL